ncbi:hypothetical protein [Fructobacillus tropaeoli]|uniref:Uncharacterized protein n=1 Tax=Fructobacillus tropaeoli TaxID=709323 RepID=A0A3F3H1S1_9LACO|nr:hypothetical protein [Fructobacillus tropaeoli]GAP04925.1 hypothetical protein FTRO_0120330 [Fructobacillus tropaeoli]
MTKDNQLALPFEIIEHLNSLTDKPAFLIDKEKQTFAIADEEVFDGLIAKITKYLKGVSND